MTGVLYTIFHFSGYQCFSLLAYIQHSILKEIFLCIRYFSNTQTGIHQLHACEGLFIKRTQKLQQVQNITGKSLTE